MLNLKIIIFYKYLYFLDIFAKKLANLLFKQIEANYNVIKLKSNKQLYYKSIYSAKFIQLETFKTYIEIKLANVFLKISN